MCHSRFLNQKIPHDMVDKELPIGVNGATVNPEVKSVAGSNHSWVNSIEDYDILKVYWSKFIVSIL